MRYVKAWLPIVSGCLVCLAMAPVAWAHLSIERGKTNDLEAMAEQAELVFVGEVVNVEYRVSEGSSEEAGLPFTLVTYEVQDVLRGKEPGERFTMRFIGGPDGRGRFLEVSGVPKFEPGERDLLFVSGNGEKGCPLVLCEWGRFRLLRGGVYNAKGSPIRAMAENRTIARGRPPEEFLVFRYPTPKFDDLMKNEQARQQLERMGMSMEEARKRYEAEAPRQIEVRTEIPKPAADRDAGRPTQEGPRQRTTSAADAIAMTPEDIPQGPVAVEEFLPKVRRMVERVESAPEPLRSIDPGAPIRIEPAQYREPGKPPEAAQPEPRTPEEAAELEALRKQNFNPVLRKKN